MTDEHWDRLQALHEAALAARDPADLERILALADPAMAAEVRAMLAAEARATAWLDRGAGAAASHLLDIDRPESIGPYRTVRLIGEGGMGVVYLVERTDVGGLAALKLLRDAWVSPRRRDRFAFEQRTLARLRHPGIAQLHDAGTLPDGTPWFVMEYVEGAPITDHCRARHLDLGRRLGLFRSVLDAVQHAHAHAVIHRDIKPSNVLVSDDGLAKLLDFGIAKQLDDTADPERTATGLRMLTPAYAAPEQVDGGAVGVHTDVHALGVLLTELVTGARPERGTPAADGHAMLRVPRDAWRELEVILRKAMHAEPARRYASVDAFRRDLERFERREPLEARPDSVAYRTQRFVRRNRRAVVTSAVALLGVIALTAFYTVRLAGARDRAVQEAARTARIQQFMLGLFAGGEADAGPQDTLRVRSLIARGIREAAELDDEPVVQAELYATLGSLQVQLGALASADSLLHRALRVRRAALGEAHPDVAATLTAIGTLRIAQARLDEAEATLRDATVRLDAAVPAADSRAIEAHAALGRVFQEKSAWPDAIAEQRRVLSATDPADAMRIAGAQVQLAGSHFYAGELDASDSLNRLALATYRRLRGDAHPLVADVQINLGAAEFERGKYADAERWYREAVRTMRAWHGDAHPATASALTMLGRALNFQQQDSAATEVLGEALAVQERVHGPMHPSVASALNDLATIALRNGRLDEADSAWRRAEAIYLGVHGERHWLLGIARSNLGGVRMARKDFRGAEVLFRQAAALFEASQGPRHLNTGIAHLKLGRSLLRQERWREAADESQRGYDILTALPEAPKGFLDAGRTDLAAAYEQLGDRARAATFRGP